MSDLRDLERAVRYGRDGRDGRDGADGLPGEPGPQGPRGLPGLEGKAGIDGMNGAPGKDGRHGVDGVAGKDGRDGIDGKDGAAGIAGKQGKPGPRGPMGPMPRHQWKDTSLRFEAAPNVWGEYVELRGPPGRTGTSSQVIYGGGGGGSGGGTTGTFNTLRNGAGPPSDELGADGDFYIDTAAWRIYGPKAEGAWLDTAAPVNMMGTLTPDTVTDNGPFEFGCGYHFNTSGYVSAVRFWKPASDSGFTPRIVRVWTNGGVAMSAETMTGETASGWQECALSTPVSVETDDVIRVSYNAGVLVPFSDRDASNQFDDIPPQADWEITACYYGTAGTFPDSETDNLVFADLIFVAGGGVSLQGPRGEPG